MANNWTFVVTGLHDLAEVEEWAKNARPRASQAINTIVSRYRTIGAELIMQEVKFPDGYLNPAGGRFRVAKKSSPTSLEGSIIARSAPTSLARFVTGGGGKNQGTTVEVHRGKSKTMKKAFLIPLPAGSGVETKSNMGLAMRLRPGETITNKKNVRKLDKGLYLLYGPSVDQIFMSATSGKGVAEDIAPDIQRDLAAEWLRLMDID